MVAFVAPWCGHCKNLGPEYTAAAQSLSPLIPFYAIDCDAAPNKPICAEYQVKGFPTIKAFPRAGKGAPRDYNGERKKAALVEYAKGLVPDRVKKLRVDDGVEKVIQKFLEEVRIGRSVCLFVDTDVFPSKEIRLTSCVADSPISTIDPLSMESPRPSTNRKGLSDNSNTRILGTN